MAEIVAPMTLKEVQKMHPNLEVKRGRWRFYLMLAGDELEKHGMEWIPPKNANILLKAAVLFWQKLFKDADIAFFKELADRMDGKPAMEVAVTGEVQHRYVARTPAIEKSTESWIQNHSPQAPKLQ